MINHKQTQQTTVFGFIFALSQRSTGLFLLPKRSKIKEWLHVIMNGMCCVKMWIRSYHVWWQTGSSSYPPAQIFQACLPIKYYNVWWRVRQREPPLRVKRDNEPWAHVKNKQRCCRAPTPVQVTFLLWNSYASQPGLWARSTYLLLPH